MNETKSIHEMKRSAERSVSSDDSHVFLLRLGFLYMMPGAIIAVLMFLKAIFQ